jgi:succinyl-diaminopimelate desuccinylase
MTKIQAYLDTNRDRFLTELNEFLRIPTVSADPSLKADVARGAQWVARQFERIGLSAEVIPTTGHPLVYAESAPVPGAPIVLVYGHYDVQPADPLELWTSPPFEPVVRDGNLYARGSTDDKGQLFTHIKSVEAWLAVERRLPVQLKFLIEGEEEVGSAALEEYIAAHAERLACDTVVISDGAQFAPGVPAITYGLRGIAYYELRLTGPNRDLHSGVFGGSVTNPANALAKILAAMVTADGRITIPGFYDDVVELSPQERSQLASLEFDEAAYMHDIGVNGLTGEAGHTTLERRWTRPTLDVNGLWSGYQGEGAKTVLPAKAGAKFSFRLVPNQDPQQVTQGLRALLGRIKPPGIEMELLDFHGAPSMVFSLDSPYIEAAARALEHAFGRRPVYTREGGSIPIVSTFHDALGVDMLLLGWGQNDDNAHSPDEKFSLADFYAGIRASARLWQELADVKNRKA